ncbi:unnamed protein product (macronuclear) [Paramecium tetraurelia]|uniref:Succinate dehydrogenase assembly factor 3, mitochondrial n=1 Tax=Paramecium tetraurelia TaxID=5888 RepID=A0D433_PARTE|nr:uncharacterized protein GSPATT00013265001 [Paramecium tetraurelia]CAK77800.1 unnamed protein product [Paramecium tetraurelia]|eukprot:XP_001445197.1 hypothetical protein (macronuclear) [Paramecium tetraurelia strain d4-2]
MASRGFISKRVVEQFTKNIILLNRHKEKKFLQKNAYAQMQNLGMKGLDIILGRWSQEFVAKMSYEELNQMESEILDLDTIDIYNLLFQMKGADELKPLEQSKDV